MNSAVKELLVKFAYGVVGLGLSLVIPFLHSNGAILGVSTGTIAAILAAVEEALFPTQPVTQ